MKDEKEDILWRIRLVYVFVALFAMMIIGKAAYIQFVEGEYYRELARKSTIRYESIDAARGDIRADDGRLLATSIPVYEIRMDLGKKVVDEKLFNSGIDSLCTALSRLFGDRSPALYKNELIRARRSQERFFLVKRNVSYNQLLKVRQFPIFRHGRYKGGLIVIEGTKREMPYKSLAARTIGYEREGFYVGLEGAYRNYLEGTRGKRLVQRTSGGHWMPINDVNEIQPKNGMDVITTINVRIQDIAENALREQLTRYNADYGTIVVMEVQTGKIKAISNLQKNARSGYEESFNFAIGESSEPGSTFKLASMIAILEDGVAKPTDIVHTGDGKIQYHDKVMRDAREGGFGSITLAEVFALSSNVGISKVINNAYKSSPQRFVNRLKSIGLDKPLGVEISGEGQPVIRDAKSQGWSAISLPWMSIGYELSITPLQLLCLYNAIANNGRMMKPMFVEEIRQTGSVVRYFSPEVINRSVASSSTIAILQEMLTEAVKNGTARNIHTPVYQIAGKTGTAQVAQTRHGYRSGSGVIYKASFAGYFPADNPAYSMIVVINNPRGYVYAGGHVAAPVFKRVADRIYATHIIAPESNDRHMLASLPAFRNALTDDLRNIYSEFGGRVIDHSQGQWGQSKTTNDTVILSDREFIRNLVPDVTGMGLRDALYVLENSGLRVQYTGRGSVKRQSIRAGTRIQVNSTIHIVLN